MYISEEIINQIKESVNIVEVVGEYVPLKKSGQNYKGLCPFHSEKTPSFIINPQKGIFHCFGCGVGGNVFNFLMKFKGITFPDAVSVLGARVGIQIKGSKGRSAKQKRLDILYKINRNAVAFFNKNLTSDRGAGALEYLKNRKIELEAISTFSIGYALDSWDSLLLNMKSHGFGNELLEESGLIVKKQKSYGYYDRFRNRIIFPIQDSIGRFIGFGARIFNKVKNDIPKYINTNENVLFHKGRHLYGFYIAEEFIRKNDSVFIVEGYFDVIRMHKEGLKNTVAPLGTALTEDQISLILRYTKNIYLAFDPDEAGKKATMRSISIMHKKGVDPSIIRFPSGKDPGDFFDIYSVDDFKILTEDAISGIDFLLNTFVDTKKVYTANEKIVILDSLVEYFNNMENIILKDEFLKKISSAFKTKEDILRQEINKLTRSKSIQETKPQTRQKIVTRVSDELELLLFILSNPDLFNIAQTRLDESYFHGKWTNKLWNAIIRANSIVNWDSGTVFDYLDDEKFIEYLSGKLMSEVWNNNPKEAIMDIVTKLKMRKIRDQIVLINERLSQAVLENNEELISELELEKQAQSNELKKLKTI